MLNTKIFTEDPFKNVTYVMIRVDFFINLLIIITYKWTSLSKY